MPTRNVVLTDYQSELIERLVASGRYQNASEVLRDGLRLIERRDALDLARQEALRAAMQVGQDDIEAGRYQTFKDADALADMFEGMTDEIFAERRSKPA